jgi:ribose transport system ATP-binding protein
MTGGLQVERLSKTFPGTQALDEVALDVAPGRVHALLGGNGSGKSTLIKILAGVVPGHPGGRVSVGSRSVESDRVTPEWARAARLAFVHQDLGLAGGLTVAETIVSGSGYPRRWGAISWRQVVAHARGSLEQLGFALDAEALVGDLRPAQRTLVAVARALRGRDDLSDGALVLDEPTARLPAAEVELVLAALRRCAGLGQSIVFVSHRLDEALAVADDVTVLRDGRRVATEPACDLDERALARLIVGREFPPSRDDRQRGRRTSPLLDVSGLAGGSLHDVTLSVAAGEVLGVAGIVGSGRTSLLGMLFGVFAPRAGTIDLDRQPLPAGDISAAVRAGVAYVPEERVLDAAFLKLGLDANISASDPCSHRRRLGLSHASERAEARRAVERFAIRAPGIGASLRTLSGGNQQKAILARWLLRDPRLLLLDEPTQGVDVGARADIHRLIVTAAEHGAAVVVASSDVGELVRLADRVVVLAGGTIAAEARRGEFDRHWLADHAHGLATWKEEA